MRCGVVNWRNFAILRLLRRAWKWFGPTQEVRITALRVGDIVAIKTTTKDRIYFLQMIDDQERKFMVWGNGGYFKVPTERQIAMKAIVLGRGLELVYRSKCDGEDRYDKFSPTKGIYVNGKKVAGEGPEQIVEFFS